MCKPLGHEELFLVLGTQHPVCELSVSWRAVPDVHGEINDHTFGASHDFSLGMLVPLEVKPTEDVSHGMALVYLYSVEVVFPVRLLVEFIVIEYLVEVSTVVVMDVRLDDENVLNVCLFYYHGSCIYSSLFFLY